MNSSSEYEKSAPVRDLGTSWDDASSSFKLLNLFVNASFSFIPCDTDWLAKRNPSSRLLTFVDKSSLDVFNTKAFFFTTITLACKALVLAFSGIAVLSRSCFTPSPRSFPPTWSPHPECANGDPWLCKKWSQYFLIVLPVHSYLLSKKPFFWCEDICWCSDVKTYKILNNMPIHEHLTIKTQVTLITMVELRMICLVLSY